MSRNTGGRNRQPEEWARTWPSVVLPALTLLFGLQMLRALLPYVQNLLNERLGANGGMIILTIFAASFSVGFCYRLLGLYRSLLISTVGVGLSRLGIQLWLGDPVGDMVLATAGILFFFWCLPLLLSAARTQPGYQAGHQLAAGLLLGLSIDVALNGVFLTYDYIWQSGPIPLTLSLLCLFVQWQALRAVLLGLRSSPARTVPTSDGGLRNTLPWLALGMVLFLELLVFQNVAHFTALSGWQFPIAYLWLLICHLCGLWLFTKIQSTRLTNLMAAGLLLLPLFPWEGKPDSLVTALVFLCGQGIIAHLLGVILGGLAGTGTRPGLARLTIVHGLSMLLLVIMIYAFYITRALAVPYQNSWLFGLAAAIIAGCASYSLRVSSSRSAVLSRPATSYFVPALALLALPISTLTTWRAPVAIAPEGFPIRILDYNVHNGFNTSGQLDLETLARTIEAQGADIVALQEVPRGWLLHGSVDVAGWLSQRLQLPYRFTPSGDPLWGHAVFSRYPILKNEAHPLPPQHLPLKRSFSYQRIDIGESEPLGLINTHLHARSGDSDIRLLQTQTIEQFVGSQPPFRLVLTGDLNATPDTSEIGILFNMGFTDAIPGTGLTPGHTYHSLNRHKQIDYILLSPDLSTNEVTIFGGTASDHLGIAATIEVKSGNGALPGGSRR